MKTVRNSCFFAVLVVAGALTFLLSVVMRERTATPILYSRPEGGEREGEFELFIGS